MNVDIIKQIQDRISVLEEKNEEFKQKITQFNIDRQIYVKSNNKIKPGVGTKLAYDENGLVLSSQSLNSSDIPVLEIDKINGLQNILSNKANKQDLANIQTDFDTIFASRPISNTGCKINYDKYGVIQSSTNLSVEDIPLLPIESVDGLSEELERINDGLLNINTETELEAIVSPGCAAKVNYDKYGRVVGACLLSVNDIPIEVFNRMNTIESKLIKLASVDTVNNLTSRVDNKIDKDNRSTSGTFTKVKVNNDGLVIEGSLLTPNDLGLEIKDIRDLFETLQSKAEHSDLSKLNSTVSVLVSNMNKLNDIKRLESKIDNSVNKQELSKLYSSIDNINRVLESINKIDINLVSEQLKDLRSDISSINTRLNILESRIKK